MEGFTITVDDLGVLLAATAAVLIVAVAAVRLSTRTGLPSLLLYLFIGMILGDAGLGIAYESMHMSEILAYLALIIILAEGGLTTSWSDIKKAMAPALVLATVGVAVSVLVLGAAAHFLLGLPWQVSLIIAAVVSSTDAAAVFSVLRDVRPLPRLSAILEAESGFNDAPVVLVVIALSASLAGGGGPPQVLPLIALVAVELLGGALIGLAVGAAGAFTMRHLGSSASGLFPIGILAWIMLSYGMASMLHCSGFIAVYLCGLVLGNVALPHRNTTRGFAQALGWIAQIGLFIMLGLLASPRELVPQIIPAIVLGFALLLVARPVSVFASTVWFRTPWREQVFMSWAGLRGAVPIVLAIVPTMSGVPGVEWIFNLVFVLVVVFTLVQAPMLPFLATRLGLTSKDGARNLEIEATPLEEIGGDLLEVTVGEGSHLHGVEVFELRLPPGCDVSLIVRDGAPFVPSHETTLRRGDQALIVVPSGLRKAAEERLDDVDSSGRLAGWRPARSHLDVPRVRPRPLRAREAGDPGE